MSSRGRKQPAALEGLLSPLGAVLFGDGTLPSGLPQPGNSRRGPCPSWMVPITVSLVSLSPLGTTAPSAGMPHHAVSCS